MSSGTNKERIVQNNSHIENNNKRLDAIKISVNELSGLSKTEYNACMEIAETMDTGIDYSGTTATANDIVNGKIAYANGERLVGKLKAGSAIYSSDAESISFSTDYGISKYMLEEIDLSLVDTSAITSWAYAFWNYKALKRVKGFVPTKSTSLMWCFAGCSNLEEFPLIDGGEFVTSAYMMIQDCKKLKTVSWFETKNTTDLSMMCRYCENLVDFPQLDTTKVRVGGLSEMFVNCPSLSDESLNNILAMCTNAKLYANAATSNKTLSHLGLSAEQRTRCQALSNYPAFLNAGWTTA